MDPLSVTSSIIAIISISGTIVSICYGYIGKAKSARKDIIRVINSICGLKGILEQLKALIDSDSSNAQVTLLNEIASPRGPLESCKIALSQAWIR